MKPIGNLIEFIQVIQKKDIAGNNTYYENLRMTKDEIQKKEELVSELHKFVVEKGNLEDIMFLFKDHFSVLYKYKMLESYKGKNNSIPLRSFFYRGISNNKHNLVSGVYRKTERHDEFYYCNEINVRCPEAFRRYQNLDKLVYMQHYGCPTRLLDITSNPLVSLYFACSGNIEQDGSVYIFGINEEDIRYAQSDRIHMLSKLSELKRSEQIDLFFLAYENILKGKFPQDSHGKYKDILVERFYHAIKRENGAFEREIVPFDLLKPQFVQPYKDNPRILKQDGAFIVSGLDIDEEDSDRKIRHYMVNEIIIDKNAKKQILNEIDYYVREGAETT